jgi:hypothetical protein
LQQTHCWHMHDICSIWPWAFSNCTDDLNTLSLEDEPTYPWLMVVWYYLIWLNMIQWYFI